MTTTSPLGIASTWDRVASGYAEEVTEFLGAYAHDALRLAAVTHRDRVLDVACGPGTLTLPAARVARSVDALDFSARMVTLLRERVEMAPTGARVEICEGDGQSLPYEPEVFDAAFSMFGLIFFPDRARGLSELFRVLRPGGRAVVSSWQPMLRMPTLTAVFEAMAAEHPGFSVGDGRGPLCEPEELRAEMRAAGFIVAVEPRTHRYLVPDARELLRVLRRSFVPLVLLEQQLGAAAFDGLMAAVERRLRNHLPSTPVLEMPAWLALGHKP